MTTIETVYEFADQVGITDIYALVLFAQAKHETFNFQSDVFVNAKNAFGMRVAKKRQQNNSGSITTKQGEYAVYNSVRDSYIDRVNLDFYNKISPPQNVDDVQRYVQQVKNAGYATDPLYVDKWLNHVKLVLKDDVGFSDEQLPNFTDKLKKFGIIAGIIVAIIGYLVASKKIKLPFKIPFINS